MAFVAGIDIGSGGAKAAIMDEQDRVSGKAMIKTSPNFEATAQEVLDRALRDAGVSRQDIVYVATTGLGRYSVSFRQIQITDITCTTRAVHRSFPDARFILDIGAQCTRAIRLDEHGRVKEFRMNEKCAAGSGGFLERTAKYLEVPLSDLGRLSTLAQSPQSISSVCAVLAESEIINHISEGKKIEDIIRGIHDSLAERALMLLKRAGMAAESGGEPVVMVGGVATQEGMVLACREKFGVPVMVPPDPQFLAATGAAILGWQRVRKQSGTLASLPAKI